MKEFTKTSVLAPAIIEICCTAIAINSVFDDDTQEISSEVRDPIYRPSQIEGALDFILARFEVPLRPGRISTKLTEGKQILVDNKHEALAKFKQANYLDCRINAYNFFIVNTQRLIDNHQILYL